LQQTFGQEGDHTVEGSPAVQKRDELFRRLSHNSPASLFVPQGEEGPAIFNEVVKLTRAIMGLQFEETQPALQLRSQHRGHIAIVAKGNGRGSRSQTSPLCSLVHGREELGIASASEVEILVEPQESQLPHLGVKVEPVGPHKLSGNIASQNLVRF